VSDSLLTSLALVGNVGTLELTLGDPGGHHALVCWHGGKRCHEWLVCRTGLSGLPYVASGYTPTLWEAVEAARARLAEVDAMPLFAAAAQEHADV